jgi:hypothetical protein
MTNQLNRGENKRGETWRSPLDISFECKITVGKLNSGWFSFRVISQNIGSVREARLSLYETVRLSQRR